MFYFIHNAEILKIVNANVGNLNTLLTKIIHEKVKPISQNWCFKSTFPPQSVYIHLGGGERMKGLNVACPVHLPHTVPLSSLHRYRLQKGKKERGGPERKHSLGDPRLSPAVLFEKGGALDACASPAHTPQKGSIPTLPTVLFR